jgi:acetyl-CoA acyltransferase 1
MESSARRLQILENHITLKSQQTFNAGKVPPKSDDDVVIVAMARTAMTKAGRGSQKDTNTEEMLVPVFKAVIDQTKIDPKLIEDVCIGSVLQNGAGANQARMAMFLAGIPETTTVKAVNRQCSSGLEAVMEIANAIRVGQIDLGIGGGVESMSQSSLGSAFDPKKLSPRVFENKHAKDVALIPMGITSENVAERFGITREKQDQMAFESQAKAAKAAPLLQQEVTPYKTLIKDKDGKTTEVLVDRDDGIRETTLESLSKLKTVFKKDGSTTAGNAS